MVPFQAAVLENGNDSKRRYIYQFYKSASGECNRDDLNRFELIGQKSANPGCFNMLQYIELPIFIE